MSLFTRFLKDPAPYFTKLKFYIAGLYYDYWLKVYKVDNCTFHLPSESIDRVGKGYFVLNRYEIHERKLIRKAVDKTASILELGGCLGVISCIANKHLLSPHNHVVVEANPNLIKTLEINKQENNCRFNIENVIISHKDYIDFYISNQSFVSSSTYNSQSGASVKVKGVRPEYLEEKHNIKFDTLVMDIEGAEYNVLTENIEFIKTLHTIFMEEHPEIIGIEKLNEYEAILLTCGFKKVTHENNISIWKLIKSN